LNPEFEATNAIATPTVVITGLDPVIHALLANVK
jgi:hypothetical protein